MSDRTEEEVAAFETSMRARFVTRDNLAKLFGLVLPHLARDGRSLVYILTQSDRIGHFTLEPQILKTLYEADYDRIVVVCGPLDRPGTNPAVPDCLGPKFRFVPTDDEVILAMGFIDGGLADLQRCHLLLQSPRLIIVDFFKRMTGGVTPTLLTLPDRHRERGRTRFRQVGLDPDAPFAFFHMRTMKYRPGLDHHGFRTASIETYVPAVTRLLDAGYQVVRLGEPGVTAAGLERDGYVSLPDRLPDDRSADLFALAGAAFGLAQNSGPIWVAAAFGTPSLRTNTPYEHLNLPYLDDLSVFKHYREVGSGRRLTYREILERRIPAILRDQDYARRGVVLEENTADELLAATGEMLDLQRRAWEPDMAVQNRFRQLGRDYEAEIAADPEMREAVMDFYGYGHPFGWLSQSFVAANPDLLT